MPTRKEWIGIIVAGLISGLIIGILILGIRFGADLNNYLNFFGGALGAGLAVYGALWIEENRNRDELILLRDAIVLMTMSASRLITGKAQFGGASLMSLRAALWHVQRTAPRVRIPALGGVYNITPLLSAVDLTEQKITKALDSMSDNAESRSKAQDDTHGVVLMIYELGIDALAEEYWPGNIKKLVAGIQAKHDGDEA